MPVASPARKKGELKAKSIDYGKKVELPTRPGGGKLRRRSTLHWTGASPSVRQKKLEDLASERMADTWFSVHCKGIDEPIYVSEVMDKSMNPDFRFFDLNASGPFVTRMDEIVFKLWAKTDTMDQYLQLLELDLSLDSLQYLGKSLENFRHPLPSNCVLFHLADGIYTNLTDLPAEGQTTSQPLQKVLAGKTNSTQDTLSYDALMQLANLDDCIQDALATREKLEAQINCILEGNEESFKKVHEQSQETEQLAAVKRAITAEKKQMRQAAKKRDDLKESLRVRRESMRAGRLSQVEGQSDISEAESTIEGNHVDLKKTSDASAGQIRRICEDLLRIYPIEPVSGKALSFTICGLSLPNSTFDDMNKEEVAAALGFTSHLVYLLSFYLSVPLPYPVHSYSSTSYIQDPISMNITQRTYPLHPSTVQYRFEYGVFLLNKNIEFLMTGYGLRMLDIRQTLPNLKYLLYVLTAGSGELPARKAGGVKGLITGRLTPETLSRRGSEDSVLSAGDYIPSKLPDGLLKVNGAAVQGNGKGSMNDNGDPARQPDRSPTMPYRTSPLREVL